MPRISPVSSTLATLLLAALLAACGGGGGDSAAPAPAATPVTPTPSAAVVQTLEPGAPQASGDMATDSFNRLNFRRQQLGLAPLQRNALIDAAAQKHSEYQNANGTIAHEETAGAPGFTGVTMLDRLRAAGYRFTRNSYAYGEVIAAGGNASGFDATENLIAAIYHRFVMLEPKFREGGAGAAGGGGNFYFTLDFTTDGLDGGLGPGRFVVYPTAGQRDVPAVFYSDFEIPDPVADRNAVGYPVSIHADIGALVTVASFSITPRGGSALPVKLLTHGLDSPTAASVAAIIPLDVLTAATTYDVVFTGTVDGVAASRSWSFSTR